MREVGNVDLQEAIPRLNPRRKNRRSPWPGESAGRRQDLVALDEEQRPTRNVAAIARRRVSSAGKAGRGEVVEAAKWAMFTEEEWWLSAREAVGARRIQCRMRSSNCTPSSTGGSGGGAGSNAGESIPRQAARSLGCRRAIRRARRRRSPPPSGPKPPGRRRSPFWRRADLCVQWPSGSTRNAAKSLTPFRASSEDKPLHSPKRLKQSPRRPMASGWRRTRETDAGRNPCLRRISTSSVMTLRQPRGVYAVVTPRRTTRSTVR